MAAGKKHLNLALIGHIDCGKSTLNGNLLYHCSTDLIQREKWKKEFEGDQGKYRFSFSCVGVKILTSREMPPHTSYSCHEIETSSKFSFSLFDIPGHRDFIKNATTALSQCDIALLVISASNGEFEAGIRLDGQLRQHSILACTFGVKQVICCVNKMDAQSVNYSEDRFNIIVAEVSPILERSGFPSKNFSFIPISADKGANVFEKSSDMPWWKGATLLEALNDVQPPRIPLNMGPLRIPVDDVFHVAGVGTVVTGCIATGSLKPGMSLTFAPPMLSTEVKSIEMHHRNLGTAGPGDNIGINLKGISTQEIRRGFVIGDSENPPSPVEEFVALIVNLSRNHPYGLRVGYTPVLDCHTAHVPCKFVEFKEKRDRRSGKTIELEPKVIKKGEMVLVRLVPFKPLCVETFKDCPRLGRFSLRDSQKLVGVGAIQTVLRKRAKATTKSAVRIKK